jgi:putative aminopeptidase FrvX
MPPRTSAAPAPRTETPLTSIVRSIVGLPTISFREHHVLAAVRAFAEARGLAYTEDAFGNGYVTYKKGRTARGARPLVLGAHTDHPGFLVEAVRGKRLELRFLGGVDARYGKGEHVRVYGEDGRSRGVARITKVLASDSPNRWARRITGAVATLEEGAAAVDDLALWDVAECRIRGRVVEARQCDDLIGAVAVLATLDRLVARGIEGHVIGSFTRAEESGLLGAAAAAGARALPEGSLVVAVECSSMAGGRAEQGAGPIIRVGDYGHIFSPDMSLWMFRLAMEMQQADPKFKFQRKLMDGGTTEATAYDFMGYETGAACVALGNYHNMGEDSRIAAETVHLDDIDGLAELFVRMAQDTKRHGEVRATSAKRWGEIGREAGVRLKAGG